MKALNIGAEKKLSDAIRVVKDEMDRIIDGEARRTMRYMDVSEDGNALCRMME